MLTIVLTGVKAAYNRSDFLAIVLDYVTQDTTLANQYVDAVIAGNSRNMSVPSGDLLTVAGDLDAAGVKVVGKVSCNSVQAAPTYNRTLFVTCIKDHFNPDPAVAGAFADDVEASTSRVMTGPPCLIATELDAAGVNWNFLSM